jgi:hypothetical protein
LEIQETPELALLFRIDSVTTKYFYYLNQSCHQYFHGVVGTFLNLMEEKLYLLDLSNLNQVIDDYQKEILKQGDNPITESPKAEVVTYWMTVLRFDAVLNLLLDFLLGSISDFPVLVGDVIRTVSKKVREKFDEEGQRLFVIGFFFLRLMCPALALPDRCFGYSEVTHDLKRFCLVMSKVLQTAANGQVFHSKEMEFANDIVVKSKAKIDLIVSLLLEVELSESDSYAVSFARQKLAEKREMYPHCCVAPNHRRTCSKDEIDWSPSDVILYFSQMFENEAQFKSNLLVDQSTSATLEQVKELNKQFHMARLLLEL